MPSELRRPSRRCHTAFFNRSADNWRPLLAIADICEGTWPERARAAALSAAAQVGETSRLEMLLGDIRQVFTLRNVDRLPSALLVSELIATEGRPWAEYGRSGRPITQNRLAYLLKPLGVEPERIRVLDIDSKEVQVRGYVEGRFKEAFARFLPESGPSDRHTVTNLDEMGTSATFQTVTTKSPVTVRKCEKSNNDGLCDTVTVREGESGEKASNGAEPGLPQATIRRWAEWYKDAAADQLHELGDIDREALNAELRRRLIEEEGIFPEHVEAEFRRIEDEVFRV